MTFCKIDGCLNHGSYGGYCTSHQSQRAERAEAERDELKRAIMRLPVPPEAMGDGPDERVTNIRIKLDAMWDELQTARAEVEQLQERLHKCDGMAHEVNLMTDEVKRLRAFVTAFDEWHESPTWRSMETPEWKATLNARAMLDAPAERKQAK